MCVVCVCECVRDKGCGSRWLRCVCVHVRVFGIRGVAVLHVPYGSF